MTHKQGFLITIGELVSDIHFELTSETKTNSQGELLYRIRAIQDIPLRFVSEGDLGGWVSSTHTADGKPRIGRNAWVEDDAEIFDNARVTGHARVGDTAIVCGNARVKGRARVRGAAQIRDNAVIRGASVIIGAIIDEHARIGGEAQVCGTVSGHAWVTEQAIVSASSSITGSAVIGGRATIENSFVGGRAKVTGTAHVIEDSHIYGKARISGMAWVCGSSVGGTTRITAAIPAKITIGGSADISHPSQCFVFGPVGFGEDMVTVYRKRNRNVGVQCDVKLSKTERTILDAAKRQVLRKTPDLKLCFELTDEFRTLDDGTRVYRIRATRTNSYLGVAKGDLGGWVSSTHTADGTPRIIDSWVAGNAILRDNARIVEEVLVQDNAIIKDDAYLFRGAVVSDDVVVGGCTTITTVAEIRGKCELSGGSRVYPYVLQKITGPIEDANIRTYADHRRFDSKDMIVTVTRLRKNRAHIGIFNPATESWSKVNTAQFILDPTSTGVPSELHQEILEALRDWECQHESSILLNQTEPFRNGVSFKLHKK
ncbi:hypothetical protein CMUST_10080 [Corynebacterium mustelae]|uniref:Uncharacterized protein n=1 Tax=Corynebacterium mustelae TaxID=571915 RepID=A0A0G3H5D5_9CORY|nr:hypothetical protein [Corynebacterium mustelae]AKK06332.1 hypothetical protein CMUST_10080 [Corynebacterium mustelae]